MKPYVLIPAFLFLVSCSGESDHDASGIFESTTVTISAETSGRILSMDFAEGDTVAPGNVVAVIDTAMLSLRRGQLLNQQESAEASSPDIASQAASLRTRIAHQESETERLRRLVADGAATSQQLDEAEASTRSLRAELSALLSTLSKNRSTISRNVKALEFQRMQIEEEMRRSIVTTPAGGTVLTKYAEAGEYAAPGKALVEIADLGNVYLRAYFTSEHIADLRLGQKVTVIADFGGDKRVEYPGTISWISQESEFTPKSIQTSDTRSNLVYAVKVAVKNDGLIKLGQYGEVRL
ncbi:MAG: HlyD family efflux transporter periplasmic adaptor subunit [[Clostridium] fimetarium]|nr:HlyD family efflux transporter periplasmic adaptor subunit [Alistipes timonensis]MCM1404833.1 HlyD family efflux transporter periplasmic adaptor subunit [[Clostridium] fimetarium]